MGWLLVAPRTPGEVLAWGLYENPRDGLPKQFAEMTLVTGQQMSGSGSDCGKQDRLIFGRKEDARRQFVTMATLSHMQLRS